MGGIRTTPKNSLRCSCFAFSLASVALPTNTLTSLESLPYYIAFLKFNVWFAFLGGTTIILGAYYVENVPVS
jgi:NADH-quinone oxidoreductase subunit M